MTTQFNEQQLRAMAGATIFGRGEGIEVNIDR